MDPSSPLTPLSALLDGALLATMTGGEPCTPEALDPGTALVLSRFAWLRRERDELVAETSRGPRRVVFADHRAAALALSFDSLRRVDDELACAVGLPLPIARQVTSLLWSASVLIDPEEHRLEDEFPLAAWEFHDLLFHVRSRIGGHENQVGATYRFLDRLPPPPAFPSSCWSDVVALERIDHDAIERADPALASVQAARRSVREYAERPISIAQLATFLWRVGRAEDHWVLPIPGPPPNSISFAAKPYPAAGSLYELELYTGVRSCQGLSPGLYHYVSDRHCLARVCGATSELGALFARCAADIGVTSDSIQVLIVMTARFARLAWKYESIAYALALKHVGIVVQNMYLVATAMGLAPCAIATGDSALFAKASGVDHHEEPAVGEFALGSSPG